MDPTIDHTWFGPGAGHIEDANENCLVTKLRRLTAPAISFQLLGYPKYMRVVPNSKSKGDFEFGHFRRYFSLVRTEAGKHIGGTLFFHSSPT